ncbi:MAG TPA: hypothetical protein VFZ32_15895 [Micromonosporaceae bacterium]
MRFKRSIVTAALALPLLVGAVAVASASGGSDHAPATHTYTPVWHNTPTSLAEAVDLGAVVVRATVVGVQQAPDIAVPAKGEPGGVDRVPTQAITFKAQETLKGSVASTFTVFRTGGPNVIVAGDPAYAVGQQYVLVLDVRRPDGRWVLVSPEGRFQIRAGKVFATSEVPGVAAVSGKSYDSFRSLVRAAS